jgi:hypothetical protein
MRALIAILVVLAVFACRRSETTTTTTPETAPRPPVSAPAPASVGAIELGRAVGADMRVTAPASTFAPTDTIYVSVATDGQPAGATLSARWTYEDGQVVNESRETLGSSGKAATEFHISKPDGWPVGRYKVEIALNGKPAGTREFEVR